MRSSGQPLRMYSEPASMITACTGACARRAIAAKPLRSGLTGARAVRVPSGKKSTCRPAASAAAAARIISFGASAGM